MAGLAAAQHDEVFEPAPHMGILHPPHDHSVNEEDLAASEFVAAAFVDQAPVFVVVAQV
jgi:hypothetical protein